MARIRSVKPELRTSLTAAQWSREVRYAWVLLWGYLDDHGRGRDDMRLVVADLFPLDHDVTTKKMDAWLTLMATGNEPSLCRYDVDGHHYLHVIKWTSHQRVSHPKDSVIPPCPLHEAFAHDSGSPPEVTAKPSGTVPSSRTRGDGGGDGGGDGYGASGTRSGRARDLIWEAMLEVCGIDSSAIPDSARGAYNKAAAQLRAMTSRPDEVRARARRYTEQWPSTTLTPPALARHWAECTPSGLSLAAGWDV